MTIVTRYDVKAQSTLVLLKYRSYNDLTDRLKRELVQRLEHFVHELETNTLDMDPFALSLWHFNATIQYFRRAARLPRDAIRQEEIRAHESAHNLHEMNLRGLHLALGSLDQDKIQLAFLLDIVQRLRAKHQLFHECFAEEQEPNKRSRVYYRVQEELERYACQLGYFRSSVEEVSGKVQCLLNLVSQAL